MFIINNEACLYSQFLFSPSMLNDEQLIFCLKFNYQLIEFIQFIEFIKFCSIVKIIFCVCFIIQLNRVKKKL